MRIAVGIDHAGVALRDSVMQAVGDAAHELVNLGECDDYPDIALIMGRAIAADEVDRGILVCGSGAGVSVAANKLTGIRASVSHDHYTAAQCVTHDDCNVLCLGARVIGPAMAADLTAAFCTAQFSGEERHVRRLKKILTMERDGMEASW
jgi:ribose 5-phosphate isomerase B